MSKNKGFEPTPAEKYLRQLDPDRAQIRRRDLLYVSKEEADSLYKPVPEAYRPGKFNRIFSIAMYFLFTAGLTIGVIVLIIFLIREKLYGGIFVALGILLLPLFLFLAVRDGLRPKIKGSDDDE